ncbi:hypothetical protein PVAND_015938 [Polypedilum vanderplanki]|uniref:Uncharacterized protein n=1 Tax=Polypedilum vanderplanki TaxID=319348 RepID=A0A9J6BDQ1_POLVA|nr:hypothetical protein PVAND_015938 [Polypedilum vanderplanki]
MKCVRQKSINFHLATILFLCALTNKLCDGFLTDNFYSRPSLYLTVNPKNHQIDINWFNLPDTKILQSTILITTDSTNPLTNNYENVVYEFIVDRADGRQATNLTKNFTNTFDINTRCYDFWIFFIQNDQMKVQNCFQLHPTWMNDMKNILINRKVRDLFLPGTHDSASYKRGFDPTYMDNLITKYSLTQDDDIKSQLYHGIRYLDLRIGYYRSNDEKFWANHGITRIQPLSDVLKQVKDFVDATNEIVILDFQEFPVGFRNSFETHQQLVMYLFQELSNYAVDPAIGWDVTLGDIWYRGNRIIVAYDYHSIVQEHSTFLFPSVRQRWGKVKEGFASLEKFLKESRENMSRESQFFSRPYAEMAELTPEAIDVITNRYGGLRKMADSVNWHVTRMYHGEFGRRANIVAVDFYLATNIIEIAIEWNKRKFDNGENYGNIE